MIFKEVENLKSITGYELMERAKELHTKIFELIIKSDLPVVLAIAVLENVKETIHGLTILDVLERRGIV